MRVTGLTVGSFHPPGYFFAFLLTLGIEFVSVKWGDAKRNGVYDYGKAIQATLDEFARCKLIYCDAGTIGISEGAIVVGKFWPTLFGGRATLRAKRNLGVSPKPAMVSS